MKLNCSKSNYMIVTNVKEDIATRLFLDRNLLKKEKVICHLGLWIAEDLTWNKNTSEICKKGILKNENVDKTKICRNQN